MEPNLGQPQCVVADGAVTVMVGGGQSVKPRGQVSEHLATVLNATDVTAVHRRLQVSRQRPDVIVPKNKERENALRLSAEQHVKLEGQRSGVDECL